eukprot:1772064-Amphidinium_carterae.1
MSMATYAGGTIDARRRAMCSWVLFSWHKQHSIIGMLPGCANHNLAPRKVETRTCEVWDWIFAVSLPSSMYAEY